MTGIVACIVICYTGACRATPSSLASFKLLRNVTVTDISMILTSRLKRFNWHFPSLQCDKGNDKDDTAQGACNDSRNVVKSIAGAIQDRYLRYRRRGVEV